MSKNSFEDFDGGQAVFLRGLIDRQVFIDESTALSSVIVDEAILSEHLNGVRWVGLQVHIL